MELESTLVDKLQKALVKVCEDCGQVTGQSMYMQLTGTKTECIACQQRNRMLYLPIKILIMKFTSIFNISEEELINRLKEDRSWNHLLDAIFLRIKEGGEIRGHIHESLPMVVGLDLDVEGRGLDQARLDGILNDYRKKGCVGVRFHKTEPLQESDTTLIRAAKNKGFLVSLAIHLPSQVKVGALVDALDHIDLIFADEPAFLAVEDPQLKDALGGGILKPITIQINTDLVSKEALERVKSVSSAISPEACVIRPTAPYARVGFGEDLPEDQKVRLEQYLSLIGSDGLKTFITVRDPGFVQWLGEHPGAAAVEEPPLVVFRSDVEKWTLPPEDFLPVKTVFSLVPMHVGLSAEAFCYRLAQTDLENA